MSQESVPSVLCPFLQPWVESTTNASGHALGADADVPWLKVTPGALRGVVRWITERYGPVEIQVGLYRVANSVALLGFVGFAVWLWPWCLQETPL
jgi:hypothetical protein